jgi:hypothetical protein
VTNGERMWREFHCEHCDAKWLVTQATLEASIVCPWCHQSGSQIAEHATLPQLDLDRVELRQRQYRIDQGKSGAIPPTCPFCAVELRRGVNQTREHVLARWISDLPMYEGVVQAAKGGRRTWTRDEPRIENGIYMVPVPRLHSNKHAHVLATTVAVCDECNSQWMSRLETQVTPILRPLIEGSAHVVSGEALPVLSRWIGKVAIAYEADDLQTSECTAEQVIDVRFGRPLQGAVIWAARWNEPDSPQLRHGLISGHDKTTLQAAWRGSQMMIAVGHVAFYMLYTDGRSYPEQLTPGEPWVQLWPGRAGVALRADAVGRADFDEIGRQGFRP